LDISYTKLDADLGHLPVSLQELYCWGTNLAEELKKYLQEEEEKVGNNYLFLLER